MFQTTNQKSFFLFRAGWIHPLTEHLKKWDHLIKQKLIRGMMTDGFEFYEVLHSIAAESTKNSKYFPISFPRCIPKSIRVEESNF